MTRLFEITGHEHGMAVRDLRTFDVLAVCDSADEALGIIRTAERVANDWLAQFSEAVAEPDFQDDPRAMSVAAEIAAAEAQGGPTARLLAQHYIGKEW